MRWLNRCLHRPSVCAVGLVGVMSLGLSACSQSSPSASASNFNRRVCADYKEAAREPSTVSSRMQSAARLGSESSSQSLRLISEEFERAYKDHDQVALIGAAQRIPQVCEAILRSP